MNINYLSADIIIAEVSKKKPGTIFTIGYTTDMPLKAEYAKKGWRIIKKVTKTVRTGVKYDNLASVIKKRAELTEEVKRNYTNPFEYTIPNRVCKHTTKGTEYLCLASFNGNPSRTEYIVETPLGVTVVLTADEFMKSSFKELVRLSYFTGSGSEWFRVSFDNIYRIGTVEA